MARIAEALATLREQVNQAYPGRAKSNDGWLGDASHQKRKSDHNPNSAGVVRAIDLTHDPKHGFDSYKFADLLLSKKDERVRYVISNRRIAGDADFARNNSATAWKWKRYNGTNPHDEHVHISVEKDSGRYDDPRPWDIGESMAPIADHPEAPSDRQLQQGDSGNDVVELQTLLGAPTPRDGYFGLETRMAVKAFQTRAGLTADGIAGPYTMRALRETKEPAGEFAFHHIVATVFGGRGDHQHSGYDNHVIGEAEKCCALPGIFPGKRPLVEVTNEANGKSVIVTIEDIGPWNTDDRYWLKADGRPQAESGRDHRGRRTNKAGIDLSPGAARALGIDGKGVVTWKFHK